MKLLLLCSIVLFGAYSQHQSEKVVSEIWAEKRKLFQHEKEIKQVDVSHINRAIELSDNALADGHGQPLGSVIVKDGKIVGEGWNKTKLLNDPSAHAEVDAIRNASRNLLTPKLSGCSIYASAKPCPMCLSLIYLTGIEKIYYRAPGDGIDSIKTSDVQDIYGELAKPQSERSIPEIPITFN